MDSRNYSAQRQQKFISHSSQQQYIRQRQRQPHNTRNRKLFIQRNSQQEQQIVIPYWDQQSSSTNYHLIQEIRLLKKKNVHFQSHMGRMKLQYEQLRMNLQEMDQNQKQHIRRHADLSQRYNIAITKIQQLKGQLQIVKNQNADLLGQLRIKQIRQQDNRKKLSKIKDQQAILNAKILELEQEIRLLRLQNQEEKKILERSHQKQVELLRRSISHNKPKDQEGVNWFEEKQKEYLNQIKLLKNRINQLLQRQKQRQMQNKKVPQKNDEQQKQEQKEKQIEDLKNRIKKLQKQNAQLLQKLKALKQQLEKSKLKIQQSARQKTPQPSIDIQQLKQQHAKQLQKQKDQQSKLRIELKKLKNQSNDLKKQNNELKRQNNQIKSQLQEANNEKKKLMEEINGKYELLRKCEKLGKEIGEKDKEIQKLKDLLKIKQRQIEEQRQKYRQASKKFKNNRILKVQRIVSLTIQPSSVPNKNQHLQQQIKNLQNKLSKAHQQIQQLQKQIQKLQQKQQSEDQRLTKLKQQLHMKQLQQTALLAKVRELEQSLAQKQLQLQKYNSNQPEGTLQQLENQYYNQLQALRRLVVYKKYPVICNTNIVPNNNEIQDRIRLQYQQKFDILVFDYQQLQKQLLLLQEQLILSQYQKQTHMQNKKQLITFRTSEQERILYMQAIRKWQIAYEELHAIYEAKLVSKDEEINLLNLRLANVSIVSIC